MNGQVRSLCNVHFVSCYPVNYLTFFFFVLAINDAVLSKVYFSY